MARQKHTPVVVEQPAVSDKAAQQIATLQEETVKQYDRALALAGELGYQGAVTVDALEGEIRFYQRRTVEAILETGKRLLVLKELTPHGEFYGRVEALGFSTRTAQRFMQAATKTTKSATVAHLSKEMKSAKAFLELVTHDDDADLEALAKLDAIDRMSATQVRQALREAKAEREAMQQVLDKKNQKLDTMQAELEKAIGKRQRVPPDTLRVELSQAVSGAALGAEQAVKVALHDAIAALFDHHRSHGGDAKPLAAGCVMQVQQALNDVRDAFELPSLVDYVPDWLAGADLPAYDPDAPLAEGDVLLEDIAIDPSVVEGGVA